MRRYETIFIIDNDLSEEDRSSIFERLKELIDQHDGLLVNIDEWGSKKLAYEIKKKARGYYVRLDYCGSGSLVNEIERFFIFEGQVNELKMRKIAEMCREVKSPMKNRKMLLNNEFRKGMKNDAKRFPFASRGEADLTFPRTIPEIILQGFLLQ